LEIAASSAPPDLILLDVMMPEIDGFEVCRRLQANPLTRNIPVIFLTAKTATEDEEMGFSVGAVDFIHKPISPPVLAVRVKAYLRIKLMQDFLQRENVALQNLVIQNVFELNQLKEFMWGGRALS